MKFVQTAKSVIRERLSKIEKMNCFVHGEGKGMKEYIRMTVTLCALGIFVATGSLIMKNGIIQSAAIFAVWETIGITAPYHLLKTKERKKKISIELELPDFMDRTALLIGAGMQLREAVMTAADNPGETFAREVRGCFTQSDRIGNVEESEFVTLEKLAAKCEIPSVNTFVSIINQNMKKGSDTMCDMLRIQAEILRTERKNKIKRIGEEAATYMLFPSILIFIAIMVMMIAPAVIMLG